MNFNILKKDKTKDGNNEKYKTNSSQYKTTKK